MKQFKEKFIIIFSIFIFAFLSQANAVEENAYDVCYEEPIYEGSMCVDMGNGFQGGTGCKQTIPIRNLSPYKLENTKIVIDKSGDNFSMGFDCGIDGVSQNGDGCEEKSSYTMNPIPSFDENIYFNTNVFNPSSVQEIYSQSNVNISMFTGDNLYASYRKDGVDYAGKIPACQLTLQFELEGYEISEDIKGPIHEKYVHPMLTLNRPTDHIVQVTYYTEDGTGDDAAMVADGDYPRVTGRTVTIPVGETSLSLDVAIYNDAPIELREWFSVHLINPSPSDVLLGKINTAQIVISAQEDVFSCFDDNFDGYTDEKLKETWSILQASGTFEPHIVSIDGDSRLRVTDSQHDLATTITRDIKFPSKENLIIIEFDYYAYGGCEDRDRSYFGADGISNILFDSAVGSKPKPGGFGGSLGYAQLLDGKGVLHNGFEGGWLGLGLDEYGNYGNCNEGRVGGFPHTSCEVNRGFIPWQHSNTAVIRGNQGSDYKFLKGIKIARAYPSEPIWNEQFQISNYLTDPNTGREESPIANLLKHSIPSGGYYSGRYKMKVDARAPDHLYISLLRSSARHPEYSDEQKNANYHPIIPDFDAYNTGQGLAPDYVRYAISASTGINCNIHEFSWIRVKGRCATFVPETAPAKGIFGTKDVWRNFDDEIISTKLVDYPFKLDIMSLKPDYSGTITRDNMDVKWALKYMNDDGQALVYGADDNGNGGYQGDWNVSEFDILDNKEFVVNEAQKDMWLEIKYCSDYNSTRGYIVGHSYDECLGREEITEETIAEWIKRGAPSTGVDYNNVGLHLTLHKGDHFSVRPTHFTTSLSSNYDLIKSGHEHNITLTAYSGNKARTKNYHTGIASLVLDKGYKDKNGVFNKDLGGGLIFNPKGVAMISEGISSLNSDGTGRNDVVGLIADDVGDVEFGIYDKVWSNRDNDYGDDSPERCMTLSEINSIQASNSSAQGIREPFSSWICTDQNKTLTFIPDHFDITNASVQNHRNGDFTYISNDLNMSANIGLKISAKNKNGDTTKNFSKEDNWYENPLSIVMKIEREHPDGDNILKLDIPAETKLGFDKGEYDINASSKQLILNYERFNDQSINPFDINGTDSLVDKTHISVKVNSTYSDDIIITGEGNVTAGSATFFYAKARPNKFFYDDIESNSVTTPISISIYCDPTVDSKGCNYPDVLGDLTDEANWYRAINHNSFNEEDGNIVIKKHTADNSLKIKNNGVMEGEGNPSISPTKIEIKANGIQNAIEVKKGSNPTLPMSVAIELETEKEEKTDSWLLYNEADPIAKPDPFYKVRFIDDSSWAGVGKEGSVINREISASQSKRMNW